jgi:acyl carrier protein
MPAETHRSRGGADRDDLLALVREAAATLVDADPDDVSASTALADLGIEGLVLLDLVELLEEELGERTIGLSVDDDELADLRTVGDVVDLLAALVQGTAR